MSEERKEIEGEAGNEIESIDGSRRDFLKYSGFAGIAGAIATASSLKLKRRRLRNGSRRITSS